MVLSRRYQVCLASPATMPVAGDVDRSQSKSLNKLVSYLSYRRQHMRNHVFAPHHRLVERESWRLANQPFR